MQNVQNLELTTYEELAYYIRENGSRPVCVNYNTLAQLCDDESIVITLHGSAIVILTRDKISVSLCSYNTPTTRKRISQYLPYGATIACRKGECFVTLESGTIAELSTCEGTNPSNGYLSMADSWDDALGESVYSFVQ